MDGTVQIHTVPFRLRDVARRLVIFRFLICTFSTFSGRILIRYIAVIPVFRHAGRPVIRRIIRHCYRDRRKADILRQDIFLREHRREYIFSLSQAVILRFALPCNIRNTDRFIRRILYVCFQLLRQRQIFLLRPHRHRLPGFLFRKFREPGHADSFMPRKIC